MRRMLQSKVARVALLVVGLGAAGTYVWWELVTADRIDSAWIVHPEAPVVVAFERDVWLLRVFDARTGDLRGKLSLAGRDRRLFNAGDFLWMTSTDSIELVDLVRAQVVATHEELCAAAGQDDLRVPAVGVVREADGSLQVQGTDGETYALSTDGNATLVTDERDQHVGPDDCDEALRALKDATTLHDADLRGCFEIGGQAHGFVQHATRAFGERSWQGTLVDPSGSALWTLAASDLTGGGGWFGDAMASGDAVWVVVVENGRLAARVHAFELDARTGDVRAHTQVL